MSVTTLALYLGVTDSEFVRECATEAGALVAVRVGEKPVPPAVLTRAILEVGADLFYRRSARNGIAAYGAGEGPTVAVRISRDPMRAAEDLLAPYLGPGIA